MTQPDPWKIPHWDPADVMAIKALADGVANEEQQKRALEWIMDGAGMLKDLAYRPDPNDTAFCLGRQQVARLILYVVEMPLKAVDEVRTQDALRRKHDGNRSSRSRS